MSGKTNIYFIHQNDILKKLKWLAGKGNVAWIFFSRDYNLFLALQKNLPSDFINIRITDALDRVSRSFRRPYIDYIASLGNKNKFDSLGWWTSRIAEKNNLISPLFLYVCYLEVLNEVLKNKSVEGKDICIISESYSLLETMRNLPEIKKGYRSFFLSRYGLVLRKTRFLFLVFFRIARFLKIEILKKTICFLIPSRNKLGHRKEYVFMRTWESQGSFEDGNEACDAFFGNLPEILKQKGFDVRVIPIILSINKKYSLGTGKTYLEIIKWLRKNDDNFIIPDDFYSIYNFFQAIFIGVQQFLLIRKEKFQFASRDVSRLFYGELHRIAFNPMILEFNLYYYLIKNFKRRKIQIRSFIFTFENMLHEKALIIGLKEFYPEVSTIGYQHSLIYPMLLCQHISQEGDKVIPLPSRIICNGEVSKDILSKEGFSPERLVDGPAFRYEHLYQLRCSFHPGEHLEGARKKILVAGMEDFGITLELLTKVYLAFQDEDNVVIWFKPHPNMKGIHIDDLSKKGIIGSNFFKVASGSMSKYLPDTDCLIAFSTGAIFEALCLGIPVIRLRREADIMVDPVEWFDEDSVHFIPAVVPAVMGAGKYAGARIYASNDISAVKPWSFKASSPFEIKERFSQIKKLTPAQKKEFFEMGEGILHSTFSRVNDESYKVFV